MASVRPQPRTSRRTERSSLATAAYERIREAILRGDLRPNERLVETALAEWLEISRTPLRESLARLEAEGLVTSLTRGWIVREHTEREVSEIHEVRAALEGMAVFLAADRATDSEIESILDFHAMHGVEALAATGRTAGDGFVEYNDAFHEMIVVASGSERLREFIHLNRKFFFTYRIAKLFTSDDVQHTMAGHDEVVAALAVRDGERGERAMRNHILATRDLIVSKLY